MDIYEYAKTNDADYYDCRCDVIFRVQAFNHAVKSGLPTRGIEVYSPEGRYLGVVKKK